MRSAVTTHRSIRKFQTEPGGIHANVEAVPKDIPDDILADILQVATRCSNNGNMQTNSVIVTKSPKAREQLALIHDTDKMVKAPVVLTFVADWTLMKQWCEAKGAFDVKGSVFSDPDCYSNYMAYWTSALDTMIYAQTVVSLAEAAGLGICFHGSTIWETERLNAFFQLPPGAHVVTSVTMGWPDEDPAPRARLDAAMYVHLEKFGVAYLEGGSSSPTGGEDEPTGGGEGEPSVDHGDAAPAPAGGECPQPATVRSASVSGVRIRRGSDIRPSRPELVTQHYESREIEGWKRYIQLYGPEKWTEKLQTHKLENLAQVYTVLKYSGRDYRLWTNRFLRSLEQQCFGKNDRKLPEDEKVCPASGVLSHCLDPNRFETAEAARILGT